jgi:transposase InsO family protein
MRQFNRFRGTKGFITTWERVIRFRYMITEEAKKRCQILAFWEKHGTSATTEAFNIKRRILFLWQEKLKKGHGKLESLNPIKKTPKNKRKRIWDIRILEEIKKLREDHHNLGKEKLYPLLLDFCDAYGLKCPGISTVGRLMKDMGGLRIFPQKVSHFGKIKKVNRNKILRKPKDFKALYPGHCIAFDTIEKQRKGKRMYIIVAIDLYTRIAFALGTKSHASNTMAHFLHLISMMFPYEIKHVLSDNGSEFKKYFSSLTGKKSITHFHTYPRTPKMNAHCERLNRSLQEEFIDYNVNLLFDDVTLFNKKFADYLTFYNEKRVHTAFKNKYSPLQFMIQSNHYKINLPDECKNGWTYTSLCLYTVLAL